MKLAFLIAAHAHPRLLARLIQRLQGPVSSIIVHIDAGVPLQPFEDAFHDRGISGVHMAPRVRSPWGTVGQVKASLSLLHEAMRRDRMADRFILISGQDYPLMSPAAMAGFFEQSGARDFLTFHPLPWSAWDGDGGLDRLRRFHFAMGRHGFTYPCENVPPSRRVGAAYAACKILLPRERPLPRDIALHGGSNWWNLSRASVLSLLQYLHCNHTFLRRFRFTKSADEIFFQTALLNSTPSPSPANDDLRYTVWDEGRGEMPAVLDSNDFDSIATSGKLFARKMEPERSAALMDRIDNELLAVK
jgi:hypothetical protein